MRSPGYAIILSNIYCIPYDTKTILFVLHLRIKIKIKYVVFMGESSQFRKYFAYMKLPSVGSPP